MYLSVYDQIEDPELLNYVKKVIFQTAIENSDICLVVKPHPLENENATKQLARGYQNILFADKNGDIKKLIRACDAFISLGTTATVDAIIANKLTICPNFPGWVWSDLFINSGAVLVPRSKDELLQAIKMTDGVTRQKVLADLERERRRFLNDWVYHADGQASARIAALAMQMVK
jgi:hypothetical protein